MTILPTDIRNARVQDIPVLAAHHRKMFEAIWTQENRVLPQGIVIDIEVAYRHKLQQQIPAGTCIAWVVEQMDAIIASGTVSIVSFPPVPHDLNHEIAYIHSIFTEKEHRGKGCAQQIVSTIIQYCKTRRIKRLLLNASTQGRKVYEKAGFHSSPDAMRLFLE